MAPGVTQGRCSRLAPIYTGVMVPGLGGGHGPGHQAERQAVRQGSPRGSLAWFSSARRLPYPHPCHIWRFFQQRGEPSAPREQSPAVRGAQQNWEELPAPSAWGHPSASPPSSPWVSYPGSLVSIGAVRHSLPLSHSTDRVPCDAGLGSPTLEHPRAGAGHSSPVPDSVRGWGSPFASPLSCCEVLCCCWRCGCEGSPGLLSFFPPHFSLSFWRFSSSFYFFPLFSWNRFSCSANC